MNLESLQAFFAAFWAALYEHLKAVVPDFVLAMLPVPGEGEGEVEGDETMA